MMRGRSVTVALSDNHKGILWMLVTGIVFMALDAIGKYLVLTYPVWQFTWARFTFHMLLLVVVFNRRLPRYVLTAHPRLQLARSINPHLRHGAVLRRHPPYPAHQRDRDHVPDTDHRHGAERPAASANRWACADGSAWSSVSPAP